MRLTLILPFQDVLEPLVATHRFPLPLGSNLGWLVHQNWGWGHTSGKLLHTLGWIVGASLGRERGTTTHGKEEWWQRQGTTIYKCLLEHLPAPQPLITHSRPLALPHPPPQGNRCLSKQGNQSELRLQEFLTLAHTPLIGRDSFPITHEPPGFCLFLFYLVTCFMYPTLSTTYTYTEGAVTT